jgi:hypothetical protein
VLPDPAAIDPTLAEVIEVVDTTGETNPNPPLIETASGELLDRTNLTEDEIEEIEIKVEEKKEKEAVAVEAVATVTDTIAAIGWVDTSAFTNTSGE